MKNGPDHLVVRRHSRRQCSLEASVRVGDAHAAQVVFSRAVLDGDGAIPAVVADCSEGGLGLNTGLYLPKGTDLCLSLLLPGQGQARELELRLRVRRSSMVSREPSYYLGTSVVDHPGSAGALSELLGWVDANVSKEGAA